jgi:hypothetical protein
MRLKQEFPMTFDEALNPHPLPALPTYYQAIKGVASGSTVWHESSACLVLALSQARGGIVFNFDDLGPNAIATDGNGTKYITDSWRKPVVYFRWPTANPDVDALNPAQNNQQLTFRDPQDPKGLLMDQTWWSAKRTAFENTYWLHSISKGANKYEYYMTPVVASGGPDKDFGIKAYQPAQPWAMEITNVSAANDNIYSYNLR